MRIGLSKNGVRQYIASLPNHGSLGAHLNLSDRLNPEENGRTIVVSGFDTSRETETIRLQWPKIGLEVGDTVELDVLPEGSGDEPAESRRSSEDPNNLLSDGALAREVCDVFTAFEEKLLELLLRAEQSELPGEYTKFKRAVLCTTYEVRMGLIVPIYKRHTDLIPEAMKGHLP